MHDVIIIGRGPAGISAALYTARAGLDTLVIAKGNGSLEKADRVDNYFGFSKTVSGMELLTAGMEKARQMGVQFIEDEVVSIQAEEKVFVKGLKKTYEGLCLILAVGKKRQKVNIMGMDAFEGKGISFCTTCDGFFFRNKKVGILGYNDYMAHEAIELLPITKDITILTHGMRLQADPLLMASLGQRRMETRKISRLAGDEVFERVIYEDGEEEAFDGLFVAYESPGASDLARKTGIMALEDNIVVDWQQRTNILNIFAAGDCTGGFLQIATAVGEGAAAGKSAIDYVREHKKKA